MKRDFSYIKTHTFRNRLFHLLWRRRRRSKDEIPGKNFGACDHAYNDGMKCMNIYPHQLPLELLDTTYHEGFHAAFPDLDDDAVEAACDSIKRLLVRMGIQVDFKPNPKHPPHG